MCSGVFEEMRAVPHNFKYHAEISYQCMEGSELVEGLTWAAGNTFIDLLDDIKNRYDQYKGRGFRIENAVLLGKRGGKKIHSA